MQNAVYFADAARYSWPQAGQYGSFENCNNYIAMVGKKAPDLEERCGYYGELLVLKAQELGLNTCWVALTFDRDKVPVVLGKNEVVYCVITVGYGFKNGKERPTKTPAEVVCCDVADAPQWFNLAVEACLLAPTARNLQRFKIVCQSGQYGIIESEEGPYSKIDLGIVKCHFELIEGKTKL